MIAVKKEMQTSALWDTSVAIISSRPIDEEQRLPDISGSPNQYAGDGGVRAVVAWQRRKNDVWNIYYSVQRGDSGTWNPPASVTEDSISSTNVRVLPYRDSVFLLTWKKRNAILYAFLSFGSLPNSTTMSTPDTLALSNEDSLDYDITFRYSDGAVVWTARDSTGDRVFVTRYVGINPVVTLSTPETLSVRGRLSNPQFAFSMFSYDGPLLYELSVNGLHEVHIMSGSTDENLSLDPNADCRNARAFSSPIIAVSGRTLDKKIQYWFDVLVMEKYKEKDSTLFFQRGSYVSDTVKSAGYNRNACISSILIYVPQYRSAAIPIVWESNRDGRSHLYSRLALIPTGGVKDNGLKISSLRLDQNYPNPFNPSTTIHFHLSTAGDVTLKIIDLLGRTVETLIDNTMSAGEYETSWDARKYSSGVYFYRLEAGAFTETKKLMLLK
jgi:hypothetical protein